MRKTNFLDNAYGLVAGLSLTLVLGLVSGCANTSSSDFDFPTVDQNASNAPNGSNVYLRPVMQEVDPEAPMILRVVGYGAVSEVGTQSSVQRRLMAIRAAKMDAYRTLAERVYGAQVQGSTTVQDMVVEDDRLRSYVDTYLHGASVISTDVLPDGSVEAVLEMTVDQGFRNCLQTQDRQRFNVDCRVPLGGRPQHNYILPSSAAVSSLNSTTSGDTDASTTNNGFYFIE
ncbi:MAG: LPP20 family lipoprotein [Oleibacter sp.]|nr:LPP20 family lipoprotein [Thalassolituus sp.]